MTDPLKQFQIAVIAEIVHDHMNELRTTIKEKIAYPRFKDLPDWKQEQYFDGVRYVLAHPECSPLDLHQNWQKVRMRAGWIWGHTVHLDRKEHPNLKHYDQLTATQQAKAVAFLAAITTFQKHAGGFSEATRQQVMRIIGGGEANAKDLMPSLTKLLSIVDNLQALCGQFNIPHDNKYVGEIQVHVQGLTTTLATVDGLRAAEYIRVSEAAKEGPDDENATPDSTQAKSEPVASPLVETRPVGQAPGDPAEHRRDRPGDWGDDPAGPPGSESAGTGFVETPPPDQDGA